MRPGCGILTITSAVNPEPFARFILNPKIIPHSGKLSIALPPLAEYPLRPVGAFDPAPDTTPGEADRRMIGKQRYGVDGLRGRQQP